MPVDVKGLLWLDLETTGSKLELDPILEVGLVATTPDLSRELGSRSLLVEMTPVARGRLAGNDFVRKMHTDNGLIALCEEHGRTIYDVDDACVAFMKELFADWGIAKHQWLIAGSGVSHFDRPFVRRHLPGLERWLAYPPLDVGVMRRFLHTFDLGQLVPDLPASHGATKAHRAVDDARAHLEEARAYRSTFQALVAGAAA